jgi:hypothetical protein
VVVLGGAIIYVATQPRGLFYVPRLEARYFLPFAPAYWLLLGWSAAALIRWRAAVGWAAAALLVGVSVYFLPGYYGGRIRHDELQSMVRAILGQAEPSDVVLLDSGGRYPVFLYHYERAAGDADYPPMETITREERHITAEEVAERMAAKAADHPRIWLAEVEVSQTDPDRLVKAWLDAHGTVVWAQSYGYNALYLYDATGAAPKAAAGYVPQYPLAAGPGRRATTRLGTGGAHGDARRGLARGDRVEPGADGARLAGIAHCRRRDGAATRTVHGGLRFWPVAARGGAGRGRRLGERALSPGPGHSGHDAGSGQPARGPGRGEPGAGRGRRAAGRAHRRCVGAGGYTLHDRSIAAGGTITLDLYWRAETAPGRDLAVFTHLLGEAVNPATQGPVWGQTDGAPGAGAYATGAWRAGDVLIDRHVIAVDAAAPAGKYQIEVGLVDPGSGARLPVADADGSARGDSLVLPETVDIAAP